MTKYEAIVLEGVKHLFKSKRPEGWTIAKHLERPFVNCDNELEKRLCGAIAKVIAGVREEKTEVYE